MSRNPKRERNLKKISGTATEKFSYYIKSWTIPVLSFELMKT